ncbi:hypothetical protein AB0B66_23490 [Catellatospora sp. NPDC049111]|uniref:hypothetical protein n=1 Tax=Catellatospora sp. NPDC049111 TaxID=3155271 RepID=UPI003410F5AF
MRRILATATLGLALLGMTACADTDTPTPGASASIPAAATSAAAAAMDKAAACAAYTKAEDAAKAPLMELAMQLDAIKADPAKAQEAVGKLTKAFTDFQAALAPIAAGVNDAELKAAVESDIAALNKVMPAIAASGGDVTKAMAALETPEFEKGGEAVRALCGK